MNAGNEEEVSESFSFAFTSKTPYSSDTRGILSTPACDVHGRLKITISKAIRKIRSIHRYLDKQSRQKILFNETFNRTTIFYLRRRVLRVKCL